MTAPFEIEATVNGGPLDGRRLVVKVHRQGSHLRIADTLRLTTWAWHRGATP